MSSKSEVKERRQFESQFYPIYDLFHQKNSGFKEKEAIFYNMNKITIFRGSDMLNFIWKHKDRVNAVFPKSVKEINIEEELDSQLVAKWYVTNKISTSLLDNKIIMRLERNPEDPVKRWPKRLILTKDQRLSGDSFYTWNLQTRSGFSNLKMTMILVALFMVFLYPIWPFAFKFAVFKISLYFLIFLLGFLLVRLALYLVLRLLGWVFWWFPNLEDDSLGFWASFKPFYSIERAQDGKLEIVLRLLGCVALGLLIWAVSQEPQMVEDLTDAGGQTIDDILDWGKSKLEGKMDLKMPQAIPDLSQILREEEEERLRAAASDTKADLSVEYPSEETSKPQSDTDLPSSTDSPGDPDL